MANQAIEQAVAAMRSGQLGRAVPLLSAVLDKQPDELMVRWLLVQALTGLHRNDEAADHIARLLSGHVGDLAAIDQVAAFSLQHRYRLTPVLEAYARYLEQNPGHATAAYNHAYYLSKDGRHEAAIRMYEQSLELGIDAPEEVHLNIANIYMDHLRDDARAEAHLEKALALNPDYASAHFNMGNLSEQQGRRRDAIASFQRCLAADPSNDTALARLADAHRFEDGADPLLARLASAGQKGGNADVQFALGKAYERLGEYDKAWTHFSEGNDLDRRHLKAYSPAETKVVFDGIKSVFDRAWFERFKDAANGPVFICGMFRTGSTLLEQLMAAHPGFAAGGENEFFPRLVAGEFPQFPEGVTGLAPEQLVAWRQTYLEQTARISAGKVRVTNKRPDNFLYIGLIKAVLPAARFVVTERDWRDVATSIYGLRLAYSQNYATRLADIRHYISLQTELVDHWESVLGDHLLRVRYEDLVLRPEDTLSRLFGYLGEAWDENCLSFHTLRNTVKTASVWQVREPLNSRSVGRWAHYRRHFESVFGADLDG